MIFEGEVQASWQAQYFRKVRCTFCGRRSTFARYCTNFAAGAESGTDFMAGEVLSQGQVQRSWQLQHFRAAAGAALSQGVIISRQAQRFRRGVGRGRPPP